MLHKWSFCWLRFFVVVFCADSCYVFTCQKIASVTKNVGLRLKGKNERNLWKVSNIHTYVQFYIICLLKLQTPLQLPLNSLQPIWIFVGHVPTLKWACQLSNLNPLMLAYKIVNYLTDLLNMSIAWLKSLSQQSIISTASKSQSGLILSNPEVSTSSLPHKARMHRDTFTPCKFLHSMQHFLMHAVCTLVLGLYKLTTGLY